MLTTNQKGALAESRVMSECIALGVGVAVPFDDERYDLILDLRPRLVRVQCKWAVRRGDVIVVTCRTQRRGPAGFVRRLYASDEVDEIGAFCADTGRCYLLPSDVWLGRTMVFLRLVPCLNNQRAGVHWAADFELQARLSSLTGP